MEYLFLRRKRTTATSERQKTLLIFAQKIYISYQEIYKNVVFKTFLYMEYIWSLKRYN